MELEANPRTVQAGSPPTVFLLSPASLHGLRAEQLASPRARFETAVRYRSPEGIPIEDAFAFCSALYFRGKLAYARHFGTLFPDARGFLTIAPGFGLVPAGWALTPERLQQIRRTPVDVGRRAYAKPLRDHAEALADHLPRDGRAVLLGSVATGKYVDLLRPALGYRLLFPRCFAGMGDMQRGAVLLRAVRSGEELEYVTLDAERHRKRA